jgi:ABC-type uncharacterized transport system substrate-binding protein
MNRREAIALLGGAAATWPLASRAQQVAVKRMGVLLNYNTNDQEIQKWISTFLETMGQLGWTDGQNIKLEYRWAGNDVALMTQLAKELIAIHPEIILSPSSPSTAVLLKQTHAIPVVFVNIVDPVGQGFVATLSHPGGNATGLVNLEPSMGGKWIELLKHLEPSLRRVAIPFNPDSAPYSDFYLKNFRSAAPSLGVDVISGAVADVGGLETFIAAQAREAPTGIIPMPSSFSSAHVSELAALTTRYRLPALYPIRPFAAAGGLVSYGNDVSDNFRRAATFVDRILHGEKPSDLPVQFPTKFNLVINLKTAKALGLIVPPTLLALADEVIE